MMKDGRPYTNENGREDSRLITDESEFVQKIVFAWIHANIVFAKTPNNRYTSYGIKHILQDDTSIYLTNNQFKDAMFLAGHHPVNAKELNWTYRIKESSPAFKYKNPGATPCSHHGLSCADFYSEISRVYAKEWERKKKAAENVNEQTDTRPTPCDAPQKDRKAKIAVTLTMEQWDAVLGALEKSAATGRLLLSRRMINGRILMSKTELHDTQQSVLTSENALKDVKAQTENQQ